MRPFNLNLPALIMTATALTLAGGLPLLATGMDGRIASAAANSYNFRTYLKDDTIAVASSQGAVTLTGTVSTEYHKTLAQETVSGLPGVRSVDNQITVAGEQPSEHSDDWITMKVKTNLAFHKNVSASGTEVQTQNGVVTLTGHTSSQARKDLTGEYAMDVDGVDSVRNDMVVVDTPPGHERLGEKVDDASITAQIKTTLLFHKSTHALATRVTTRDGVVTVHGEAVNMAEKNRVTRIAEDIKGVRQVNNRMTLRQS
jgi:osmotically-inducible protein OsmY